MLIEVTCDHCKKIFLREKKHVTYNLKNRNKQFCSKECSAKSRAVDRNIFCDSCGKPLSVTPTRLKRSRSGKLFCSHACSNKNRNSLYGGEKHHMFNGYSAHYRKYAFANYPHRCAICGWDEDEEILDVHHIDEDRTHNDIENLIILCPICHTKLTRHRYKLVGRNKLEKI